MNQIKLQAELVMRTLQAADGADRQAIAAAFRPLLAAIAAVDKQKRSYETKVSS